MEDVKPQEVVDSLKLIERAENVVKALQAENLRAEAILSRKILSGSSEAGSVQAQPVSEADKIKADVDVFLKTYSKPK